MAMEGDALGDAPGGCARSTTEGILQAQGEGDVAPGEGVRARTTTEAVCGEARDPGQASAEAFVANTCSPIVGNGKFTSGRFWVLAEDSSDEEEKDLLNPESSTRERYVSNSILTNESSCSIRQARREHKRRMQRWAAKELAVSPSAHKVKPSSEKNSRPSPEKKLPVLLPSTFILEGF
jgi:hypothetical protein